MLTTTLEDQPRIQAQGQVRDQTVVQISRNPAAVRGATLAVAPTQPQPPQCPSPCYWQRRHSPPGVLSEIAVELFMLCNTRPKKNKLNFVLTMACFNCSDFLMYP
ncbi:hypothetical protein EGW08_008809 [Elysia chlorotica]|uniref:Uncharacterized protein n=1 Tax=Elysia chlorotica TaxID=188477 RepID=A0A433TPE9_ELYCH|nr:hypothetical protein EGW08_008809 [Elysia chlorotica]